MREGSLGQIGLKRLVVGMLGTNCYLIFDKTTKEGYVIDAGSEAKKIISSVRECQMNCLGVLCTHGHMDHVGAAGKVAQEVSVPVYISREDSPILTGASSGISLKIGSLLVSKPSGIEFLEDGQEVFFGDNRIEVLSTPGHTRGSISFLVDDMLFCGDLIFEGSIGRTDLKGGSFDDLLASVKSKVFTLPDETRIFPGHGPPTTVGREKRSNPFLMRLR